MALRVTVGLRISLKSPWPLLGQESSKLWHWLITGMRLHRLQTGRTDCADGRRQAPDVTDLATRLNKTQKITPSPNDQAKLST